MKTKFTLTCIFMCTAYISNAKTVMEITVSDTKMSPDTPITITLDDNHYFLINGEESGYWNNKYLPGPMWAGISSPPTNYRYTLYLKDPKTNNPETVLSFTRTDTHPRPTISIGVQPGSPTAGISAPQLSRPTSSVSEGAGFNVTGYLTNGQGKRVEKTLDFSPAVSGKSIGLHLLPAPTK